MSADFKKKSYTHVMKKLEKIERNVSCEEGGKRRQLTSVSLQSPESRATITLVEERLVSHTHSEHGSFTLHTDLHTQHNIHHDILHNMPCKSRQKYTHNV